MWAKRLVATAVLGGIVAAAGCETCQSCKKSDGGMPPTVGYGSPAPSTGGLPPAVGQTLPTSQSQMGAPAGVPGQMPPAAGAARPTGLGSYGGTGAGGFGGGQ